MKYSKIDIIDSNSIKGNILVAQLNEEIAEIVVKITTQQGVIEGVLKELNKNYEEYSNELTYYKENGGFFIGGFSLHDFIIDVKKADVDYWINIIKRSLC